MSKTLRRQHCGVNAAVSTGRRGRRPLRVCEDNLLKFEIFAVPFRFRAEFTKRLELQGGGWDKISEIAVGNGEQMALKIFAIL